MRESRKRNIRIPMVSGDILISQLIDFAFNDHFFFQIKENQFGGLAPYSWLDGHRDIRKLSTGSIRHQDDEYKSRSLRFAQSHRMGISAILYHFRMCSWVWWSTELVPIIIIVAAIISAQLCHLYSSLPRVVHSDG